MTRKAELLSTLQLSGGNTIDVIRKSLPNYKVGQIDPGDASEYKIFVSYGQSPKEQAITTIHELIHIVECMVQDGTHLHDPNDYDLLAYFIYNTVASVESAGKEN